MALEIQTFHGLGSDASGSSGASNRVITLSNTGLTQQNGFLVYVSGLALALTTEYTVSHLSASTTITFLNGMWDDMTIVVQYVQGSSGVASDFENGPLTDFGVTAVRTPVTMTTDFHGNKTYTDGTDENMSAVFNPITKEYTLDKAGLAQVYDATVFIGPNTTLNKYDKVTHDSKVYRVDKVSERDFNGTGVFRIGMLFYISDE